MNDTFLANGRDNLSGLRLQGVDAKPAIEEGAASGGCIYSSFEQHQRPVPRPDRFQPVVVEDEPFGRSGSEFPRKPAVARAKAMRIKAEDVSRVPASIFSAFAERGWMHGLGLLHIVL